MSFTIIGGKGFVGDAVATHLRAAGHEVFIPDRGDPRLLQLELGHVIYAAGLTADFRSRPFDTMRAHVGTLTELLEHATFDSLLYLSSSRIYRHAEETHEESSIALCSENFEDYFDLTKLAGEALCHASGRRNVRVARLANVIGPDFRSANFIFDLIRSACRDQHIVLRSALNSEKDYVMVDDVAAILPKIALEGQYRCYNVAYGSNISHAQIVDTIAATTGASFAVNKGAPASISLPINILRLKAEFEFFPQDILSEIPRLVNEYREITNTED